MIGDVSRMTLGEIEVELLRLRSVPIEKRTVRDADRMRALNDAAHRIRSVSRRTGRAITW